MLRRIITIDEEKCDGCGLCVDACHEGAIVLKEGKAVLLRDDYCDGLGDCLPACPRQAITFEMREALPYDEAAVAANMAASRSGDAYSGCAGVQASLLSSPDAEELAPAKAAGSFSLLRQWPVQLKLVPVNAPYLSGADLLLAADCTAYAYGNFHRDFMKGKVTLIACPKLDDADYTQKLIEILRANAPASLEVAIMSVPCCQGLLRAARAAITAAGKNTALSCRVITPEGEVRPPS